MLETLRIKCENLMTLIPSNLYIHAGNDDGEEEGPDQFMRLTIPKFLTAFTDQFVKTLVDDIESHHKATTPANQVYLYIDPFKLCYLTWPILTDLNQKYTLTLGPLINEHLTAQEIRYMGYKMKLSTDNCFVLESFYGTVPYFNPLDMARIASFFIDYLSAPSHLPQIIRKDYATLIPRDQKVLETKFEDYDFVEHNYAIEGQILHAIEIGDIDYINLFTKNAGNAISIPIRYPSDPLRERKNLAITMNSISLRAALKGGLSQSIAHGLSHNFAILIEQQTTPDALNDLQTKILKTYTDSVKKYGLKGYSETVKEAITYIRVHLTDKLSLKDVASHLHMSSEHLSRTFKKEVHTTLTAFIHQTKISESCPLLTSDHYSISDIAYMFNYSSSAHYTKVFTEIMGLSPKKWADNQKAHK